MNPFFTLGGLLVASIFTIGFGVYFVKLGVRGFQEKEFPLTDERNISGSLAMIAALLAALLGAIAIFTGVVISAVAIWRIGAVNNSQ